MNRKSASLVVGLSLLPAALLSGCAVEDGEDELSVASPVEAADSCAPQSPVAVTASAHDGNVPANVTDGDLGTRWSALGRGSWIQLDLGASTTICRTAIAWYRGDVRRNRFRISVSEDGRNFRQVYAGESSGSTTSPEPQTFTSRAGRYVRVTVDGNTANDWASILEIQVFGGSSAAPTPSPTPPPPSGSAKPDATNTGPRVAPTRRLTAAEALAELRATRRLSGAIVTGTFRLSGADGRGWVIEDCRFERGGHYVVQSYASLTPFAGTRAERPVLRYVEIVGRAATGTGRSSASVYGSDLVLDHADIYGSDDGIKATGRMDVLSSWIHDSDHPSGAHCDAIQIRSGTDILVRGSRLDSYVGYSSDGSTTPGGRCSGALQTGSVTGPISARWENNWFAGGHYTIRGSSDARVSYVFRNNTWMTAGTSVALGRTNLQPNTYGPVTGNLGDFDASNVWEGTGAPVR